MLAAEIKKRIKCRLPHKQKNYMGQPLGNHPLYNVYYHFPDHPEIKEKKLTGPPLEKGILAFYLAYLLTCFLALSNHFTKSEIQTKEGEDKYVFQKNIFLVQKYFHIAAND